jgi:ferrous iron transport protein B
VIIGMYAIGIVTALVVAFFLKRNVLKAPTPPLVMEMPPYRVPSPKSVLLNVYQNAGMFVRRAGTIIFVLSIVLWWLTVFPLPADEPVAGIEILMMGILVAVIVILGVKKLIGVFATRKVSLRPASSTAERTGLWHSLRSNYGMAIVVLTIIAWAAIAYSPGSRNAQAVAVEQSASAPSDAEALEKKKVQTENSYAGRMGRAIEPAVRPLGFDDEMGFALIASFAAREVFVSALKIIHTGAEDEPQTPGEVWTTYREDVGIFWGNVFSLNFGGIIYKEDTENRPLVERYSPLTALSTMVFFVLAMQCMSTLAIVRRETNSWKYPIVMFVYMTVLAYVVSLLTYQGGSLLLGILR